MEFFDEPAVKAVLDEEIGFAAAQRVFEGLATKKAEAFSSVRDAIGHADALFGNKSGFDRGTMALGLKAGGYWRHNIDKGLTNHQSLTVLFDPDTGRPEAGLSGNYLTAIRTAASCAVAIDRLARKDVRTLSVVGTGFQASFHIRAAVRVRTFERINLWNRTPDKAEKLAGDLADLGLPISVTSLNEAIGSADVLITLLSSFERVVPNGLVEAGTHISAMGTDTVGKQELDPRILQTTSCFTDDLAQSITLGEAQHAVAAGLLEPESITPLSSVFSGSHKGRQSDEEITLYDGTGMGLQDIVTAKTILPALRARAAS